MPYQIVCDGVPQDLGNVEFLLSPQDLAAYDLVPTLIGLGVASLKIEGRLKSPEYVANVTKHYRRAIDDAWEGRPDGLTERDVRELELSFSRGFSHGFLDGTNHKILVRGDHAKKRGIFLGTVTGVTNAGIRLNLGAPVKNGDGLVLDGNEATGLPEQGGRVYQTMRPGRPESAELSSGPAEIRFGRHDVDLQQVKLGQRVWKTDDPELTKRLRKTFEGPPHRLIPLDLEIIAETGQVLSIEGRTETGWQGRVESPEPLSRAERLEATEEGVREQLSRLGGSVYTLRNVSLRLDGAPMIPKSLLNQLRRSLVAKLDESARAIARRSVAEGPVLPVLKAKLNAGLAVESTTGTPTLSALCRTTPQIEAAIEAGMRLIYAEYQDIKDYSKAVAAARHGSATIFLATPRIEKPSEANIFRFLAKQGADGLLIRNAGGLAFCAEREIPFVADFSMNATNELTVELLKSRGAVRVTASYDLNVPQLEDLLKAVPKDWLEIVVHQQIPMFHMEHCVYCAFLSPGTDATNCGRPCDTHDVKLRDRVGKDHPLKADVGCRNTLYNATAQSAAEYLPRFINLGTKHLRVEFLNDTPNSVLRTIGLYRDLLAGRCDAAKLWRELRATSKYGVTRGALNIL